jgi:hypothetical protein
VCLYIDPDDKGVMVNIFYKHSRVKQYLKEGRAMRIETVVNCPRDLACNARLPNLAELQDKARAINRRIQHRQDLLIMLVRRSTRRATKGLRNRAYRLLAQAHDESSYSP